MQPDGISLQSWPRVQWSCLTFHKFVSSKYFHVEDGNSDIKLSFASRNRFVFMFYVRSTSMWNFFFLRIIYDREISLEFSCVFIFFIFSMTWEQSGKKNSHSTSYKKRKVLRDLIFMIFLETSYSRLFFFC